MAHDGIKSATQSSVERTEKDFEVARNATEGEFQRAYQEEKARWAELSRRLK